MENKRLKWPYILIAPIVAILCMLLIIFETDNKIVYMVLSMAIGILIMLIVDGFEKRKIVRDLIETNKETSKFKKKAQQWPYNLIILIGGMICMMIIVFDTDSKMLSVICGLSIGMDINLLFDCFKNKKANTQSSII